MLNPKPESIYAWSYSRWETLDVKRYYIYAVPTSPFLSDIYAVPLPPFLSDIYAVPLPPFFTLATLNPQP